MTIKGDQDSVPCQSPYLTFFIRPISSNDLTIEFPEIALRLHEIVSHVINILGMKILWRRSPTAIVIEEKDMMQKSLH